MVVDNNEAVRRVFTDVLTADGYPVTVLSSTDEALAAFRDKLHELVVVDLNLPGMNDFGFLEKIKELSAETLLIIITSNASLETAVAAMRVGAYDFLSKPFEDLELISAVVKRAAENISLNRENAMLIEDLIQSKQELEEKNEIFRNMAIRDGLTGLYNHRHFQELLSLEVERAQRHSGNFSLIFLDVDHFKKYNDCHGHVEGDYLLCCFAEVITNCFRKSDLVARYGGEEFVILLPETAHTEAVRLAEELRKYIEQYPFKGCETQPLGKITASIGVSSSPLHGMDAATLMKKADVALYCAKREGRNRVCEALTDGVFRYNDTGYFSERKSDAAGASLIPLHCNLVMEILTGH